jgi:starvation-inducible DNA-binding protein
MTVHISRNHDATPVAFRTVAAPLAKAEGDVEDARSMLVSSLRRLLADVISFSLRAHGYHWNVIGSDFAEYHALYGSIYEDVESSVDPIAESIRALDGMAPFRLPDIMALRSIVDVPVSSPMPAEMSADLHAGNMAVLVSLNSTFEIASAANEQGIANLISERIESHQKHAWMLKSSLAQ